MREPDRAGGEGGVAPRPRLVGLLEHQHAAAALARRVRSAQAGVARAGHDHVPVYPAPARRTASRSAARRLPGSATPGRRCRRRCRGRRWCGPPEPDRDVHALVEPQHLDRAVALVVVHRHDEVVVAADGAEERGVGRQRAVHVDAVGDGRLDGGLDLLGLLAAPEQAVLPRVRVDAADRDAGRVDAAARAASRARGG